MRYQFLQDYFFFGKQLKEGDIVDSETTSEVIIDYLVGNMVIAPMQEKRQVTIAFDWKQWGEGDSALILKVHNLPKWVSAFEVQEKLQEAIDKILEREQTQPSKISEGEKHE
jgi:hypothetical protein